MERFDETYVAFKNPADQIDKGLDFCRRGNWKVGMEILNSVAAQQKEAGNMPSRYYSYLGYGMAMQEKRINEGIKLCRYAIKVEWFQPENYVNLARAYLLAGRRGLAYKAVEKGLKVDANHPELQKLYNEMGMRRPPVVSFLSRGSFVNQILGRVRHALRGDPDKGKSKRTDVRG